MVYGREKRPGLGCDYLTAPGQMKDVYLPDSTLVALAGDSWIRYDAKRYDKERRAVEVKEGLFPSDEE